MSIEAIDPRHAKIDQFEAVIKAYAEKLGIEFEMANSVREDILRLSEHEDIDEIIADATQSLRLRFDAVCTGVEIEDDGILDIDFLKAEEETPTPALH